jgi:hypothetical protein
MMNLETFHTVLAVGLLAGGVIAGALHLIRSRKR